MFFGGRRPARAFGLRDSELSEGFSSAGADVTKSSLDHEGGVFMVHPDAVAGDDHTVRRSAQQPFSLLLNAAVGLWHGGLDHRIGVIKPEDQRPLVPFCIGSVDDQAASMTKRQRSVGVRREPQHDFAFNSILQIGKSNPAFGFRALFKQLWSHRGQFLLCSLQTAVGHETVRFCDGRSDGCSELTPVRAEVSPHAHDSSDHRTGHGLSVVFDGVLQRDEAQKRQGVLVRRPRHAARVRLQGPLHEDGGSNNRRCTDVPNAVRTGIGASWCADQARFVVAHDHRNAG